jgi:hypothetical protein
MIEGVIVSEPVTAPLTKNESSLSAVPVRSNSADPASEAVKVVA